MTSNKTVKTEWMIESEMGNPHPSPSVPGCFEMQVLCGSTWVRRVEQAEAFFCASFSLDDLRSESLLTNALVRVASVMWVNLGEAGRVRFKASLRILLSR
jgi:hypothetical protein